MGFLEGLYNVIMNVSEKAERRMDREVTKQFREASRGYDDEDTESVKRYTEAKERMQEFQKQKAEFDQKKADLKYRYEYEDAVRKGDVYGQRKAAYDYEKSIDRANYEQQKINNMIKDSDVRIQKERKFYNETLPKIVAGIELTKSTINNITDRNYSKDNSKNMKEDDYLEKLLILYEERINNQDIKYVEDCKKQEEIIHKVQSGKTTLTNNQSKGNFGEMLVDSDLRKKDYIRISIDTVTSLFDKTHQGIDGIYYNANVIPNFIIIEAKYNTSRISTIKAGYKETSSEWLNDITGQMETDRIKQSLGDMSGEDSDDLAMELFESQLAEDGNVAVVTARISDDNKTIKYIEMDEQGEYSSEFRFGK